MVNAIWAETGLRFPPKVEPLPRQARSTAVSFKEVVARIL